MNLHEYQAKGVSEEIASPAPDGWVAHLSREALEQAGCVIVRSPVEMGQRIVEVLQDND
ncbi:MAG: hypothetical protein GXP09_02565 [Gammaproteobacteria bacterium]|nr:hypothetical protein [Gammaproteobacteria bacterium]